MASLNGIAGLSLIAVVLWSSQSRAAVKARCLGSMDAPKGFAVYLHGFEDPGKSSREERLNQDLLQKLADELKLRIAIPVGPVCSKNRLCWPAKNESEVLKTFEIVTAARKTCFDQKDYTLIGFSNGGYYAFKLYKAHSDPFLKKIIASSSSGLWDPQKEKTNPLSTFHLIMGRSDITRSKAERFMGEFRKADPKSTLTLFDGGHRMDFVALQNLLEGP